MKQIALILLMYATSLVAMADGWEYEDDKAILVSIPQYLDEDYTCLNILVLNTAKGDEVLLYLYGEIVDFDFRPRQEYIVVSFFDHKKSSRWKIKEVNVNDQPVVVIVDSANFIKRLRSTDTLSVKLPVYEQGTQTFTFSSYGYPLDW